MSYIEELVKEYREGKLYTRYKDLVKRLAPQGRPDSFAINELSYMLPEEDEHTSEQIVRLLVDISIKTDPFSKMTLEKYHVEAPLVRDDNVIRVLADQALGRSVIKERCIQVLVENVPHDLLRPYADRIMTAIEKNRRSDLYTLLAKTGDETMYEKLRKTATRLDGTLNPEAAVALATLGDGKLEQKLILVFLNEKDPMEKVSKAQIMAYIGTPGSLYALGSEMRSPLVQVIPGAFARSVRICFIPFLQYAFPLEEELYRPIEKDEDYIRIEKFLERTLGVKWKVERPPFLTEIPLPPGFSYTPPK
jgi:hypothetical protein